jgi:hypothetical protein
MAGLASLGSVWGSVITCDTYHIQVLSEAIRMDGTKPQDKEANELHKVGNEKGDSLNWRNSQKFVRGSGREECKLG